MELQSNKVLTYIFGGFILVWLLVSLSFALEGNAMFPWIATTLLALLACITFSFEKTRYVDGTKKLFISENRILWHSWTERHPLSIFRGIKVIPYSSYSASSKKSYTSWHINLVFRHASANEGVLARVFTRKEDALEFADKLSELTALPVLD
ncbi:hypothetical protein ACJJJB_06630 [Microbulbifer sp. ANSA001]|uniref:hypothetical protein n=1 Tax=Microbulbifer sp. ANSA001 TaxID=3243358 RepID=UPI0040433970